VRGAAESTYSEGVVGVKRRRPFARRRLRTRRPPGVLIRFRNPWVRLRRIRLGWYVTDMIGSLKNGMDCTTAV